MISDGNRHVERESSAMSGASSRASAHAGVLLSRRRLRVLRALAERATEARSDIEACAVAAATLGENARDLPFALIYLLDSNNDRAQLAGATPTTESDAPAPDVVALDDTTNGWWPARKTIETGALQRVSGLNAILGSWPGGKQSGSAEEAALLPIANPGQPRPAGFLLAGLSPRLTFDDDYRGFLMLTANHIAAAVAHARAREEEQKRAAALAEIERARLELRALQRTAQDTVSEAERQRSEFLANISHEIRSPLTAILGYSDILSLHLQNPDDLACVKTIKESGNYLLALIDDILDLSRIEGGRLRIRKEPVPLHPLLREIQSLMSARAREKALLLTLQYEGEMPDSITTDRARLRQILVNLLGNAIKFTERGGVQVGAKFHGAAGLLQIDITDTGIGMSHEFQCNLFKAFTQEDTSLTRHYGGMGLGLAISNRLAEMLGGKLTCKSEPGQGSTFSVMVPTDRAGDERPADGTERTRGSTLSGCRVLVADDRADIRYLLRQFLEDAGAQVFTAANGLAAIEGIQAMESTDQAVDLVIMDMAMPGLDGYQATRRLREGGFNRPIIALTAAATREDRDRCLGAGCDSHLTKPVNRQALLEMAQQFGASAGSDEPQGRAKKPVSRILLVDDHRKACESTARLLEMSGYEVRTALDGKTAIAVAQDFEPDAVILDITLPDMNGYELLKKLKENPGLRFVRSIALSGYGEEETRSADPNVSFDHFLLKPVDIARLEALLS
jgi:signal transduction histidine kinase/DNA-binding response OmpR family regulator